MEYASWLLGACLVKPLPSQASHYGLHRALAMAAVLAQADVNGLRYFGGTKLGTGGLVRAYGQAARDCLRSAEKITHHRQVACSMQV